MKLRGRQVPVSSGCRAFPSSGCSPECGVALWAAWAARSVVLLAFGADSFIEMLSAAVVLLQFSPAMRLSRERAARAAGWLLYALAAAVVLIAALALWGKREAAPSWPGMIITALAMVAMPLLAWAKRRTARQTNDRALAADAVQSAACAYLAAVTLLGLAANAALHMPWVDSAAAVLCVPAIVIEARRAMRGEVCECGH